MLDPSRIHRLTLADDRYPPLLREIADPPPVLYAVGRIELLQRPHFAIVGSRNATAQGAADAEAFARVLSDMGFVIASGLALGIDAAAHRGGLAGASSSVAVVGTGIDVTYPRRNAALTEALRTHGCVLSELPFGTPPAKGNFPRRNRLISGLSRGVLVVEAAQGSGSLRTVESALQQNREVFAMPGSIHSPLSKGCHGLIKEGAKLVESAADIAAELGMIVAREEPAARRNPPRESDPVLLSMGDAPVSLEQIAQRTGLGADKLAARVSRLEIEGRIAALAGGWFQRLVKSRVIE